MKLGDQVFASDGSTGPWTVLAVEVIEGRKYVRVGFGPPIPGYVNGWMPADDFAVVAEAPVEANLGKYKADEVSAWIRQKTGSE